MEESIISIFAFCGTIATIVAFVFTVVLNCKMRHMKKVNRQLSTYIKTTDFLLMRNGGDDPCESLEKIIMPQFSQSCECIVKAKGVI